MNSNEQSVNIYRIAIYGDIVLVLETYLLANDAKINLDLLITLDDNSVEL